MRIRNIKSFSLVELMMSVFIFVMIMGGLYAGLIAGGRSWQTYDAQATAQREARRAYYSLSRDLRIAEYLDVKQPGDGTLVLAFTHPDEGRVVYR
jgi:type II secretory pathway component PulJ